MLRLDINILFTIINLLILLGIFRLFLFKPIHKILDARQAELDKQYADARQAQDTAEALKKEYEDSKAGVNKAMEAIINEAREKAYEEYTHIVTDARTEASQILRDAHKNAKMEEEKRIKQAKEQIADLVIEATAKMVASKQSPETDRELYNQFIAKTGEKV